MASLGARVIDHDVLARRVVEPGSAALADIVGEFGDRVVTGGALDRAALAHIVFADDQARERSTRSSTPTCLRRRARPIAKRAADGVEVVVHDIPLLVETGQGGDFDMVVCVDGAARRARGAAAAKPRADARGGDGTHRRAGDGRGARRRVRCSCSTAREPSTHLRAQVDGSGQITCRPDRACLTPRVTVVP